jgi:hypothetical protein
METSDDSMYWEDERDSRIDESEVDEVKTQAIQNDNTYGKSLNSMRKVANMPNISTSTTSTNRPNTTTSNHPDTTSTKRYWKR